MTAADRKRQQEHIRHWRQSAERDWLVAIDAFKLGHYSWALFIAHLVIEKLLKAVVIQQEQTPPFTHSLTHLAEVAGLAATAEQQTWFKEIQDWNIEARYDDEKLKFHKKATKTYATTWFSRVAEVRTWLHSTLG